MTDEDAAIHVESSSSTRDSLDLRAARALHAEVCRLRGETAELQADLKIWMQAALRPVGTSDAVRLLREARRLITTMDPKPGSAIDCLDELVHAALMVLEKKSDNAEVEP